VNYLSNFWRKIIYAVGILVIFTAIYPYKLYLAEQARQKDLGEATIGEVDTGSFVLKLFLLGGFRGMAANVLWTRAIDYQKVQEWDKLKVTVDMITKLQPHFLSIWTFQSWNLTYNVSVEWDAPEDKYEWIKRGIMFVREGVRKNQKSPDLIWDTAWYYYHKLGFSDESIILRRLFRDDDEKDGFKTSPLDETLIYHDNFQIGHDWFVKSVELVDKGEQRQAVGELETVEHVDAPAQRKGQQGDLPFRSMPAHAQTRYAIGLEKMSMKGIEATFGPKAMEQWKRAYKEWHDFGMHVFDAYNMVPVDGKLVRHKVKLDDNTITQYNRWIKEHPGNNPPWKTPFHENQQYWSDRWSDQMNYSYWLDRCDAEGTLEGTNARKLFYEGTMAYKSAEFKTAVDKYKEGLQIWDKLLKEHQPYRNDDLNKKDTGLVVKRYARACQQEQIELPPDTPFLALMKDYENDNTKDPFDAMEMLDNTSRNSGSAPKSR
jgi:hypothetical protein